MRDRERVREREKRKTKLFCTHLGNTVPERHLVTSIPYDNIILRLSTAASGMLPVFRSSYVLDANARAHSVRPHVAAPLHATSS